MLHQDFLAYLLLIILPCSLGTDKLPNGNFDHFGPCVLKFVRLSDTLEYVDLSENLIHANNPTNLIYTISQKLTFRFDHPNNYYDEMSALDFKFYEVCTITVFVKYGINYYLFHSNYFHYTRDGHRGVKHSTLILISKQSPKDIIWLRYPSERTVQRRIFALHLTRGHHVDPFQSAEIEWFFICPYCKYVVQSIDYTRKVKTLTMTMFRKHWRNDIELAIDS